MLILEGPDNSGKSTLANAVQGWLGDEYCKVIKSPASISTDWKDEWKGALELWDKKMTKICKSVSPNSNNIIIFTL